LQLCGKHTHLRKRHTVGTRRQGGPPLFLDGDDRLRNSEEVNVTDTASKRSPYSMGLTLVIVLVVLPL
jgi:hypothetical protein